MAKIVCLANSRKHGNRCVAGLHRASRHLLRPVSSLPDGAISIDKQRVGGQDVSLLDIIEIPLEDSGPDYGFQPENRSLRDGPWRRVGRATAAEMVEFCETGAIVLHNNTDRVPWRFLQGLDQTRWKSLQLVRADSVRFYLKTSYRGNPQVRANFCCGGSGFYDLVVTDMVAHERIRNGGALNHSCILLVSLGGPYPEDDPDPQCYKLVAGVIELTG
jgi:hypothetical protein